MAVFRNFARALTFVRPIDFNCYTRKCIVTPAIQADSKRFASFKTSPIYDEKNKYTDYEISQDPVEWSYVTRLFKPKYIPTPPKNIETSASGWKSPQDVSMKFPYFVSRTKNHMQPVYIDRSNRNLRRVTVVRKIEGDIVALEAELKEYIEKSTNKRVGTQISEPGGIIKFRGDYVNVIRKWLDEHGF